MTALIHMTDEDLKAMGIPMVNSWSSYMVLMVQFFLYQYFAPHFDVQRLKGLSCLA